MRMNWLVIATAVGCSRPEPEPVTVHHAEDFGALVLAVQRDDAAAVAQWNESLLGMGEAGDGDAAARIGAAQGFLRVAMDAEERRDGLVALAQGCGSCHADHDVRAAYAPTGQPELDAELARVVFPEGTVPTAAFERLLAPQPDAPTRADHGEAVVEPASEAPLPRP